MHESSTQRADRRRYPRALGVGLVASLLLHLGFLLLSTAVEAPAADGRSSPPELVVLPPAERPEDVVTPPALELPAPPPEVVRPGVPVAAEPERAEAPPFIPHDTPPRLLNAEEVRGLLHDAYPPALREEGVHGAVLLWLYVDDRGRVLRLQLRRSSGQAAFDSVAQEVARRMRYRPALNRTIPVGVWVAQPIRFEVEYHDVASADEPAS